MRLKFSASNSRRIANPAERGGADAVSFTLTFESKKEYKRFIRHVVDTYDVNVDSTDSGWTFGNHLPAPETVE